MAVGPRVGRDDELDVRAGALEFRVNLRGATIVPATTTNLVPDAGHLHVLLDDTLISMTQGTDQTIRNVTPAPHRIQVEFVASAQARMVRVGELLTGDRGRGEDLAQHGFAQAYAAWRRIRDVSKQGGASG